MAWRWGAVTRAVVARAMARTVAYGSMLACSASSPVDRMATVNQVLAEWQIPSLSPAVLVRQGSWRVFADTTGGTSLYLLQQIAALGLPEGPIEVTAPLTYFRFDGSVWKQITTDTITPDAMTADTVTVGSASVQMPAALSAALQADLSDRQRVYFYRVARLSLSANADGGVIDSASLASRVRTVAQNVERDAARLLKVGFISADAEP